MEKLVKLLNEYVKDKYGISWSYELEIDDETGEPTWWIIDSSEDYFEVTSYYITMKIISKRFWFIERLVENDYINMDKVERDAISYFTDESPVYWNEIWTDRLIMMLSVSNFPIKDLIYYLGKEDEHYTEHWWYKLVFNAKKS